MSKPNTRRQCNQIYPKLPTPAQARVHPVPCRLQKELKQSFEGQKAGRMVQQDFNVTLTADMIHL